MAASGNSLVGRTVGSYRVERLLGVGSVGAVYVARHVRTGGPCAIKVLHRRACPGDAAWARLAEESRALSSLRHRHMVAYTDLDRQAEVAYLVMELIEGESLQRRLARGVPSLSQAQSVLRQVGSALSAAHRLGLCHGNLKPDNVFLDHHDLGDEVVETARVGDFCLSGLPRRGGPSAASHYTAPEVLLGGERDGRGDQFALSVLAYRMLSGRLPFPGESMAQVLAAMKADGAVPLAQVAPELPGEVVAAVHRGLLADPGARFASITELVRALCDAPSGPVALPVAPASAPAPAPLSVAQRRPPTLAVAAVGALLGLGGVIVHSQGRPHGAAAIYRPPLATTAAPPAPPPVAPAPAAQQPAPPPVVPSQAPALLVSAAPPPLVAAPISPAPPARPAAPAPDPAELLRQAQDLFVEGDHDRALALARTAARVQGDHTAAAWRFIGALACRRGDALLADRAHRHLPPEDRQLLVSVCRQNGLDHADGRFQTE